MAHTANRSKLLRFSLAAFALTGGGFGAGCSGTAESEDTSSATASSALVVSTDLVISQVYGGGGNTGATYTHDFIELFNRGTTAVSLSGKSLQYVSSTGKFTNAANVVALPNASIPVGSYYLVQLASGGAVGSALPTADLVTAGAEALGLANSKGKIALVDSSALLNNCGDSTTPCTDGAWIDFVAYGVSSQAESAAAGTTSNTTAAVRKRLGCVDTGNNANDFVVATPAPRNAASTAVDCATVPADAGPGPVDAGTDTGVVVVDSGTDAGTDSGAVATDAGKIDSGVRTDGGAKTDAGAKADAAGVDDAGEEPVDEDAGTAAPKDAGAAKKDSGAKSSSSVTTTPTNPPSSGGCSVSRSAGSDASTASGLGFFGLALAALGRRRRKA